MAFVYILLILFALSKAFNCDKWSAMHHHQPLNYIVYNVLDYGAQADGQADDSKAFLDAWSAACENDYSIMYIPGDKVYLLQANKFSGPCGIGMRVQLNGALIAPGYEDWSGSSHQWLTFEHLNGFILDGSGFGTINGQGETWWRKSCKVNPSNRCHPAPKAVTITGCNNTIVQNLNFVNSQQMHLVFDSCTKIRAVGLNINAPGNSPNTDGIHFYAVQDGLIQDSIIATGDDCISIQTKSARIRIKNVVCGPGHGISIGSLGKGGSEASVRAVIIDGVTLKGTTNGLRIKSWQGVGVFTVFFYQNVKMVNVANPIIIDQYYCKSCHNQTSAVEVSGVVYKNVSGTSSTPVAVKFACSDTVPCHGILLTEILLTRVKGGASGVTSFCENAKGFALGHITPQSCFTTSLFTE